MSDVDIEKLLAAARLGLQNAYAPYSQYRVGAALLDEGGGIFQGCNVENASYGLSICAERNAIFHAVASGSRRFVAMAIVADGERPPLPCGACRQVLAEFCSSDFPVYVVVGARDEPEMYRLEDLLPMAFSLAEIH